MRYTSGFRCYLRGLLPAQNSNSQRCPKPLAGLYFLNKVSIAIILIAIVASLIFLGGRRGLYPRYGKIVGIEYDADCYLIEDLAGLVWEYGGIEDLSLGDDIAMLMWDRMSPEYIYDDVILEIQ